MKNNLILIAGFLIGFLLFDFLFLWNSDGVLYSIQNFIFTSVISLLFYRLYILLLIIVVANILWYIGKHINKDLTLYVLIFIFVFFIFYSVINNDYFFLIPSIFIPVFIKFGMNLKRKKGNQ